MTQTFSIILKSVQEIKRFVDAAQASACDVQVHLGKYEADGKSIMGMFALDMAKPVMVDTVGEETHCSAFRTAVTEFISES